MEYIFLASGCVVVGVVQIGSLVIIGVWLVILPILLRKRNAISALKPDGSAVHGEDSTKNLTC